MTLTFAVPLASTLGAALVVAWAVWARDMDARTWTQVRAAAAIGLYWCGVTVLQAVLAWSRDWHWPHLLPLVILMACALSWGKVARSSAELAVLQERQALRVRQLDDEL